MKRSGAPSRKTKTSKSSKPLPSSKTLINASKRTTAFVLDILKDAEKNVEDLPEASTEKQPEPIAQKPLKENVPVVETKPSPKAYTVLWAKKSLRKHKKWEGDGVLEVNGREAILKDEEGKKLGQINNLKSDILEPGSILSAGNLEVEVSELIPEGSTKVISVKRVCAQDYPQTVKRPACQDSHSNQPSLLIPITLPRPSKEHEWAYNTKKESVNGVTVPYFLAKLLRPHQKLGVTFLYECVTAMKQIDRFGAILADEMGLGKTLQSVTLMWILLRQGPYGGTPVIKRALVVTPSSLTDIWKDEIYRWIGRDRLRVYTANAKNKPTEYINKPHYPIFIISYEMFVRQYDEISNIPFDLMICDEGHRLKNTNNKAFILLSQLPCKRRIILTGTPIQNDLQEFFALVDFVNPGFLGTNAEFTSHYVGPILASREPNVDETIKELGMSRAKELNEITGDFILRRTQAILDAYLPTKIETVLFCKSTPLQQRLYAAAVKTWNARDISRKELNHLSLIMTLRKICNHPSQIVHEVNVLGDKVHNTLSLLLHAENSLNLEESGKVKVLLSLLERVAANGEKIVIVSSFTQTLGMLENLCQVKDYKFLRLDGSVAAYNRHDMVTSFNNPCNKNFIFLLSAKAGGTGLNLSGASRLVLFDSDWNPATDLQAMSRVWRDGQRNSVYLYRFLTSGTIEEKIYQRQISKTGLSGTVVDPANTSSVRLSDEELKDIFSYDFNVDCATHLLLNCKCACDGTVPESNVVKTKTEASDRGCQLDLTCTNEESGGLRMNQLMEWEHHKPPYDTQIFSDLCLIDACPDISFMFRHQSNL